MELDEKPQAMETNSPPPATKLPRARWLVWISIVVAVHMFLATTSIEAVSESILVIILVMSVSLAATLIPSLIYIAINGLSGLRFVKASLTLLVFIVLIRIALELATIADIMRATAARR